MATRFKFRKKLQNTKLRMLEAGQWAAGNTSVFMESAAKGVNAGLASLSARNAAIDLVHAGEDYFCSDYKCLVLDSIATGCYVAGAICAFLPSSGKVFGVVTSTSCFCRTLRNKCKEVEGGLFGCK